MTGWNALGKEKAIAGMEDVLSALQDSLASLESELAAWQIPDRPDMEEGLKRLISAGGKRLRPSLAWICYHLGENPALPIQPLMCMLELMHTASLIHDDIVDDAPIRRGVPTIHAKTDRRTAVESGDYLLGKAMEYLREYRGTGINEALADVSGQMCRGEFSQMRNLYRAAGQNEATYLEQCRQKTAYLLAASCYCGGAAGGLDETQKQALRAYGEGIGIAFQLKDDLLDFSDDQKFGKARGQDLKNGLFTLPVLYAFEKHPDSEMIRLAEKRDKSDADIEKLIQYVTDAHGIEYTSDRIRSVTDEAIRYLADLPDGVHKRALIRMAETLGQRTV